MSNIQRGIEGIGSRDSRPRGNAFEKPVCSEHLASWANALKMLLQCIAARGAAIFVANVTP
jgi:hypothetical protein